MAKRPRTTEEISDIQIQRFKQIAAGIRDSEGIISVSLRDFLVLNEVAGLGHLDEDQDVPRSSFRVNCVDFCAAVDSLREPETEATPTTTENERAAGGAGNRRRKSKKDEEGEETE